MTMVIDMNESKLKTLEQLRAFLQGTLEVEFSASVGQDKAQRYAHIQALVRRFGYAGLPRADKAVVLRYLERTTGYSRQQLTRLVAQAVADKPLRTHYGAPRKGFTRTYTSQDVQALAQIDALHGTLSGPATKHLHLMQRAFAVYADPRYERLARISVAHLYNLRRHPGYIARRQQWSKTRSHQVPIGVRKAPQPDGRPGYIRIDSVHQGDQDGIKGLYHINTVDCLTQWQIVATCERISEAYLLPVLEGILEQFPFAILGIHADNGSEYINHTVARLLERLRIEFTKSRPRHSNDNALVETKNGAVIRKHLGYAHIPQHFAQELNAFVGEFLNPYVNFHRPCLFPESHTNAKGKITKRYPQRLVSTPLEKLASLSPDKQNLKPDTTLPALQAQAAQRTDNQAAEQLNQARTKLFASIHRRLNKAA
jgi:transposase InsO family protein